MFFIDWIVFFWLITFDASCHAFGSVRFFSLWSDFVSSFSTCIVSFESEIDALITLHWHCFIC